MRMANPVLQRGHCSPCASPAGLAPDFYEKRHPCPCALKRATPKDFRPSAGIAMDLWRWCSHSPNPVRYRCCHDGRNYLCAAQSCRLAVFSGKLLVASWRHQTTRFNSKRQPPKTWRNPSKRENPLFDHPSVKWMTRIGLGLSQIVLGRTLRWSAMNPSNQTPQQGNQTLFHKENVAVKLLVLKACQMRVFCISDWHGNFRIT